MKEGYGPDLTSLAPQTHVGVEVDGEGALHLRVGGIDYGVAARDVPRPCWPVVDLYGMCEQVVHIHFTHYT